MSMYIHTYVYYVAKFEGMTLISRRVTPYALSIGFVYTYICICIYTRAMVTLHASLKPDRRRGWHIALAGWLVVARRCRFICTHVRAIAYFFFYFCTLCFCVNFIFTFCFALLFACVNIWVRCCCCCYLEIVSCVRGPAWLLCRCCWGWQVGWYASQLVRQPASGGNNGLTTITTAETKILLWWW